QPDAEAGLDPDRHRPAPGRRVDRVDRPVADAGGSGEDDRRRRDGRPDRLRQELALPRRLRAAGEMNPAAARTAPPAPPARRPSGAAAAARPFAAPAAPAGG